MKNSKKAGIIFLIMVFVLALSFKYIYLSGPVSTVMSTSNYRTITIRPGTSGRQIASILYDNGLIRSERLFYLLLRLESESLKAGTYDINKNNTMHEILDILVSGKVATFRITIPEGYTVEEISERFALLTPYSKEDFLQAANRDMGRNYLKESNLPRKYLLEGFLYPNTYIFPREFTPEQIFESILVQFENRWLERLKENENDDNIYNRARELTPFEILTIASMIEKEAKFDSEKPLVAAVIYNRLEQNILLQLDATVQYALEARKSRLFYRDLEVDSLYNTYRHSGLPPGPIANPGSSSIEAALNPADEEYLFYFATSDGSHVFTHSYSEHLRLLNEMRD
ncbi:endolytic transglycosylase MltG [Natronospora cellulosivora (SeqCode)]